MIIFAYYGLGKTTLCQYDDKFVDLDSQYYRPYDEDYLKEIQRYESEGKIVLVNATWFLYGVTSGEISGYEFNQIYLPKTIEVVISRLNNRPDVHQSFINDLMKQGNGELNWIKNQLNSSKLSFKELDSHMYLSDVVKY